MDEKSSSEKPINTRVSLEHDFIRDAAAHAIGVKRDQLDRSTLVIAAADLLRKRSRSSTSTKKSA